MSVKPFWVKWDMVGLLVHYRFGIQLSCEWLFEENRLDVGSNPASSTKIKWRLTKLTDIYKRTKKKVTMNKLILGLAILLVIYANGIISTKFLSDKNVQLQSVIDENKRLSEELNEYETEGIHVTVTMYQPVARQTDSTPNILADGTRIRTQDASNYKFIAVSRNLLKRWGGWLDYGDFILLRGTDGKDGVYQVRDTMNSRWVNRIDILESIEVKPYKFERASIVKTDLVANIRK